MPGAKSAVSLTRNGRVGVIGTEATIRSLSYKKAINKINRNVKVFGKACPLFVPLVEEGWLNHLVTKAVAKEYIRPLLKNKVDTIVLGCTHYPLIKKVIQGAAGGRIKLVDSAQAVTGEVNKTLVNLGLENRSTGKGSYEYFVSDIPQKFAEIACRFLGRSIKPVRKVVL
jgi:glutamate racemase